MRSFKVCECGKPLTLVDGPTPQPVGTQVLLKVKASGVCHSDIHIWDGYYELGGGKRLQLLERGIKLPLTLGHENVGEVVAVGPDAKGVTIGATLLANPWIGCGTCADCQRGEENLCKTSRNLGVFSDGGYADYLIVPHPRHLFEIGSLKPEQAAPLACSGITAFGAVKKLGKLEGQTVVVYGAGGVGLMGIAFVKAMGGYPIAVDIDPAKRAAAIAGGAVAAVDGRAPDAAQQIITATNGGAALAVDFVGSSDTVKLAIDSLVSKGGKIVIVGFFGGDITIPTPYFPMRAMTIQGSYTGSLPEMKEMLDFVQKSGMPLLPVETKPLEAANAALSDLKAGKVVGRVVLTPN
jgi:D-arabinose 1-dehydrogenase-like Zn-dependent alcohol dehydrogenase